MGWLLQFGWKYDGSEARNTNDTAAAQCIANPGESLSCTRTPPRGNLGNTKIHQQAFNMEDGSV